MNRSGCLPSTLLRDHPLALRLDFASARLGWQEEASSLYVSSMSAHKGIKEPNKGVFAKKGYQACDQRSKVRPHKAEWVCPYQWFLSKERGRGTTVLHSQWYTPRHFQDLSLSDNSVSGALVALCLFIHRDVAAPHPEQKYDSQWLMKRLIASEPQFTHIALILLFLLPLAGCLHVLTSFTNGTVFLNHERFALLGWRCPL